MNEPVSDQHLPNITPMPLQNSAPQALDPNNLNLRDIHLPDPVSWWPIAPGWWIILVSLILIIAAIFVTRKIYRGRQLNRDIKAELEEIKQRFRTTQNKVQLAKALSILLRRASISYYPGTDIAGLTGKDWLSYLDNTHTRLSAGASPGKKFISDVGEVLLSAPYLPDEAELDFDAHTLVQLCESWLRVTHKTPYKKGSRSALSQATLSPAADSREEPS